MVRSLKLAFASSADIPDQVTSGGLYSVIKLAEPSLDELRLDVAPQFHHWHAEKLAGVVIVEDSQHCQLSNV